jgi:hypothetical protein
MTTEHKTDNGLTARSNSNASISGLPLRLHTLPPPAR